MVGPLYVGLDKLPEKFGVTPALIKATYEWAAPVPLPRSRRAAGARNSMQPSAGRSPRVSHRAANPGPRWPVSTASANQHRRPAPLAFYAVVEPEGERRVRLMAQP